MRRYQQVVGLNPKRLVDAIKCGPGLVRLYRALAEIPAAQRDAFLLHEEAGLSLENIAMITGSNRETVKSRLRYAQKKLRAAIANDTQSAPAARGDIE